MGKTQQSGAREEGQREGGEVSKKELPATNTFHISFDTRTGAGLIRSVKVTLEEDLIDMDDSVRIDLAEHPLYKKLQTYVKENPR